jgi:pentapeptide MXKDX repeat protein
MKLNRIFGLALISALLCSAAVAPVLAQDSMAHASTSSAMPHDSMKKSDGMMQHDSMKSDDAMKSSMKHMKKSGMKKGDAMSSGDAMKGDAMKSDGK